MSGPPQAGSAFFLADTKCGILLGVADVTWSAYALAMFSPEQRAQAVAASYEPPDSLSPIPPPPAPASGGGLGFIVTGPGIPPSGYNPNVPGELAALFTLGWRYEAGRWIAPGSVGTAATSDQSYASGGARPSSLSSVTSASSIQGASVLGTTVPFAPPVLLPSFVGGALGVVRIGGGMRPESGGTPKRVVFGPGSSVLPQVRMGTRNWGR